MERPNLLSANQWAWKIIFLSFLLNPDMSQAKDNWPQELSSQMLRLEKQADGDFGLYVKCLEDGTHYSLRAEKSWYLSSTTKTLVAYSLMKEVEAKKIRLDQKLTLKKSDFVDGSGPVLLKKSGSQLSVEYLLRQMLLYSDSTATDMLIRLVGIDKINEDINQITKGFGPLTSIIDVRREAYAELHPQSLQLSNLDFIKIKRSPLSKRAAAFAQIAKVPVKSLAYSHVNDAFEAYYKKGKNSATLVAYGVFLEKLSTYQLLSRKSTDLILHIMETMKTGKRRIQSGLPPHLKFAQKTGTQLRRMCNVGLIRDAKTKSKGLLVTACVENFKRSSQAEKIFAEIGASLQKSKALNCLK